MGVVRLGQMFLDFTRQVRWQSAVDLRVVGASLGGGFLRLHRHRSLAAIDQGDLCRPLFAGTAELGAHAAQQLQLELVDHQLEQRHLAVARFDDAQQLFDGVRGLMGRRHGLIVPQSSSRRRSD
jgi:hypothetical protein